MIEQILKLLQSGLDENIEIAKQIIKGQNLESYFDQRYKVFKNIQTYKRPVNSFYDLFMTDTFFLVSRKMTEIPTELLDFPNLEVLNLGHNYIQTLPNWLSKLEKLKHLGLVSCGFTEIPQCIFDLKNLEGLDLECNRITKIPKEIKNLTNLNFLNICWNKLTELPTEFETLTNIDILILNENKISEVPTYLQKFKKLRVLDFSNNPISKTDKTFLTNLNINHLEI